MKLIGLIGSLRKGSFNRMVFEAYKELLGDRVELTEGKFDDFPLYNADLHTDSFPEPVLRLGQMVKESDGLIFFSPEYNYSVPGALKNAIDWLSRLETQPFAKKPATVVGASPGKIGTARMQYQLRQIAVFLDLHFLNKPEVMISQVPSLIDTGSRLSDEGTRKFLLQHGEAFMTFIAEQKR